MLTIKEVKEALSEDQIDKLRQLTNHDITQEELDEALKKLPSGATPMTVADAVIRSVPTDWLDDITFYLQTYMGHEMI